MIFIYVDDFFIDRYTRINRFQLSATGIGNLISLKLYDLLCLLELKASTTCKYELLNMIADFLDIMNT